MGFLLFQAFGEKDQVLIEEIAKLHDLEVQVVAEQYKEMLEKCEKSCSK